MKSRAIPFNTPMVRAILDGSKTQTRRIIKPNPNGDLVVFDPAIGWRFKGGPNTWCPYGKPDGKFWVREKATVVEIDPFVRVLGVRLQYAADGAISDWLEWPTRLKDKPKIGRACSNGCFREAARIFPEITGIRVERLQDISEADAKAEGAATLPTHGVYPSINAARVWTHRRGFEGLWKIINGADSWESNPWLWVIEFKKEKICKDI